MLRVNATEWEGEFLNGKALIAGISALLAGSEIVYRGVLRTDDVLRPPGFQNESDFLSRCIKCGRCIEACPYMCIGTAPFSSGAQSGTPQIDPRRQACRLCDSFPCTKTCPTGALRDVETIDDVRMGTAVINYDLCIAMAGNRCEVCYRACPLIDKAITIDYTVREGDAIHSVFAPKINADECVGCGICVERCVVSEPEVAISIKTKKD